MVPLVCHDLKIRSGLYSAENCGNQSQVRYMISAIAEVSIMSRRTPYMFTCSQLFSFLFSSMYSLNKLAESSKTKQKLRPG